MQFNGIGSGHGAEMHHVTECMHDHAHYKKEESAANMGSAGMNSQAMETAGQQAEGQLSLSAWLEKMLGNGKRLLKGFWNGGDLSAPGQEGTKDEGTQSLAQIQDAAGAVQTAVKGTELPNISQENPAVLHSAQVSAASAAAPVPKVMEDNPYFSTITDTGGQEKGFWQKARVKFRDVKGQLTGYLPGKYFNAQTKNSFQAKQQRPRQDLRKHSRFHGDELEIDCILTDDSYLLDSYDRKGAYSKLSAKK